MDLETIGEEFPPNPGRLGSFSPSKMQCTTTQIVFPNNGLLTKKCNEPDVGWRCHDCLFKWAGQTSILDLTVKLFGNLIRRFIINSKHYGRKSNSPQKFFLRPNCAGAENPVCAAWFDCNLGWSSPFEHYLPRLRMTLLDSHNLIRLDSKRVSRHCGSGLGNIW